MPGPVLGGCCGGGGFFCLSITGAVAAFPLFRDCVANGCIGVVTGFVMMGLSKGVTLSERSGAADCSSMQILKIEIQREKSPPFKIYETKQK